MSSPNVDSQTEAAPTKTHEDHIRERAERAHSVCYSLPWGAIILVSLTIALHGMVLWGNMATAEMFGKIGQSTHGWSEVGLGVSDSMIHEIEADMNNATNGLTDALRSILTIQQDMYVLFGHAGNATKKHVSHFQEGQRLKHASNKSNQKDSFAIEKQLPGTEILASGDAKQADGLAAVEIKERRMQDQSAGEQIPPGFGKYEKYADDVPELKEKIKKDVEVRLKQVQEGVKEFWKIMHPALIQVGKFMIHMGGKMEGFIEQFGSTIDKTEKIMDQIMSKISGPTGSKQHLIFNTFSIMDVHHVHYFTASDMHAVANLFGVTAFAGAKAPALVKKFDSNNDGKIDIDEWSRMVDDPSLPGVLTYILRCFAKKLSQIAGQLNSAKKRDEVAEAVVEYFQLMLAKNLTKCQWVSQAVVNGSSMTVQEAADIFRQFTVMENQPDKLSNIQVGKTIIGFMVDLNATGVDLIMKEVESHKFWHDQGFNPLQQPKVVHQLLGWVNAAKKKQGLALLQEESSLTLESLTKKYEAIHRRHGNQERQQRLQEYKSLYHSEATQHVANTLMGTQSTAGPPTADRDVTKTLSGGVMALPLTLHWKQMLVWNATDCSQRFQKYCFDYAKTSSNQIDSFGNQIMSMVKKIQSFLHLMMKYSSKRAINQMGQNMKDFVDKSGSDINHITDRIVDDILHPNGTTKKASFSQVSISRGTAKELHGVFKEINDILNGLKGVLPPVIGDIKFAHKEIGHVASTLKSIFSVFKAKGNPIFQNVKSLYSTIWTAYFALFATMTLIILWYAFWAYGFFGGPDAKEAEPQLDENGQPKPLTCGERMSKCCNACLYCMRQTQDSHCCFWSCILFSQIIILLLFIISIVLSIVGGVKAILNVGCLQIYLLGHEDVCSSILVGIKNWMTTFWEQQQGDLKNACVDKTLTTCNAITHDMVISLLMTTGGSMAAALFSFQMLFLSAQLHEKAVWANKLKALPSKNVDDQ